MGVKKKKKRLRFIIYIKIFLEDIFIINKTYLAFSFKNYVNYYSYISI